MLLQCAVVAFQLTGWMMTRVQYRQRSQCHGAAIQDGVYSFFFKDNSGGLVDVLQGMTYDVVLHDYEEDWSYMYTRQHTCQNRPDILLGWLSPCKLPFLYDDS